MHHLLREDLGWLKNRILQAAIKQLIELQHPLGEIKFPRRGQFFWALGCFGPTQPAKVYLILSKLVIYLSYNISIPATCQDILQLSKPHNLKKGLGLDHKASIRRTRCCIKNMKVECMY